MSVSREFIAGVRRGAEPLPAAELLQMAGRCGRDCDGLVTVLAPSRDCPLAKRLLHSGSGRLLSRLHSVSEAAEAFAARLADGRTAGETEFASWLSRTLAFRQGTVLPRFADVRGRLLETGCVFGEGGRLSLSRIGRLAVSLGFRLDRAGELAVRLRWLSESGLSREPESLSWAFAEPSKSRPRETPLFCEWLSCTKPKVLRLDVCDHAEAFSWWCLLSGRKPDQPLADFAKVRAKRGRVLSLSLGIDRVLGLGMREVLFALRKGARLAG